VDPRAAMWRRSHPEKGAEGGKPRVGLWRYRLRMHNTLTLASRASRRASRRARKASCAHHNSGHAGVSGRWRGQGYAARRSTMARTISHPSVATATPSPLLRVCEAAHSTAVHAIGESIVGIGYGRPATTNRAALIVSRAALIVSVSPVGSLPMEKRRRAARRGLRPVAACSPLSTYASACCSSLRRWTRRRIARESLLVDLPVLIAVQQRVH